MTIFYMNPGTIPLSDQVLTFTPKIKTNLLHPLTILGISHLSLPGWEHIILTGHYKW